MGFNSTIRQKVGECKLCDNGKNVSLTKGLCHTHYWQGVKMKSINKLADKEDLNDDEDVATLKKDADILFSRWLRMSAADKEGNVKCFICDSKLRWQDAQCMHYVKRGNSFLRYDNRNCKVGDKACNEYKDGNYVEYTKKMEAEHPGITQMLIEEGNLVYSFTRHELKELISELTNKINSLK
jgi:hypothetical protein